MREIIKYSTHMQVPDYEIGDCGALEGILSNNNNMYHRRELLAMDYNEETSTLYYT